MSTRDFIIPLFFFSVVSYDAVSGRSIEGGTFRSFFSRLFDDLEVNKLLMSSNLLG